MIELYFSLWDERADDDGWVRCFESGKWLPENLKFNLNCYSHILSKSKYPQYKKEKWNIKIVSPEAHNTYECSPEKAPHQNELRIKYLEQIKDGKL